MKCIKSNLACILLSIIVSFTGMCLEIEKAHSCFAYQNQTSETEMIDSQKNTTLYIGNSTGKLITGLRDAFPRNQSKKGRISLKSLAEFLLVKESLQSFLNFWCAMEILYLLIQSNSASILNYIHKQDGEK